ncbi:hypothetical protein G1L11_07685 [Tenacibaculum finnmarkense]|uniref:hypothetical protein n=1 Tax=Tenacibaculum finnmarkense TaxID=2781243 RepID=UPI001EFBB4F2|nr:hypothetical protein [Tenacibaculum finnmarkense]MCG8856721.1 hypothetical protein [Tenacibaculum finnmarkense]
MKKVIKVSLVAICLMMFASCSSDDDVSRTPKIKIEVVNAVLEPNSGKTVDGAIVIIYGSNDFESEPITQGLTGADGTITFEKNILFDKEYFVDVEKGCRNNYNSLIFGANGDFTVKANSELEEIEYSTKQISIKETGTVVVTNISETGYLINFLGKKYGSIAGNESITLDYYPVNGVISPYTFINVDNNDELDKYHLKTTCGVEKEYFIE